MTRKTTSGFMKFHSSKTPKVSEGTKCHCEDFIKEKKIGEPCICKIYVKQKK